ncbi:hydroxyacid dehydrogenase [Falsirhodobacter halotolerans]|uniref:hydroxyacid dehydrogenase n=1 Tax=Falsirhodobacter halotolerans TaxID=1146892 RepID=UPI001FD35B94|nr:hydroxyacid dehydrogenase [Falsirhodobacter halotolerans]MCJ8139865.1 hydroxyacid dehydrogenase [Falsirhodobacter halotolerans]
MPLIYVTSTVHADTLAHAARVGDVVLGYGPDAVPFAEVQDRVDAVLLRAGAFGAAQMDACPRLRIVARHGAGFDTVDIPAATARGIWVTNTPGANSRAVAEHVFALVLSLARKLDIASAQTRGGAWSEHRAALNGAELHGRTLGLLGQGTIGRIVSDVGRALGMTVLVCDPAADPAQAGVVTFDRLLAEADVLSLHVPLLPSTRHIIDAQAIAAMKTGAILINTGRGGLVDEEALAQALISGKLGGAGLDVLEAENTDMIAPMAHNRLDIAGLPNLIVTPHVAGQTDEALIRVGQATVAQIATALSGGRPEFALNDPAGR